MMIESVAPEILSNSKRGNRWRFVALHTEDNPGPVRIRYGGQNRLGQRTDASRRNNISGKRKAGLWIVD